MSNWEDEFIKQINECETHRSRLKPSEGQFLSALREQLNNGKPLTPNQERTLAYVLSRVSVYVYSVFT
jgi:hypothetical protein